MAVRFDLAADRLLRTTGLLDYNSPYTWMAWVSITTNLVALSTFWALSDGTVNNTDRMMTTADGVTLQARVFNGGVSQLANGTALVVGTWAHLALVRESATVLKVYLNGNLDITNTLDITARIAANRMEHGAFRSTNVNPYDGRVAAIKAWSAALTQADVQQERLLIRPNRLMNLYGFWPTRPGVAERLKDYSGNGRDWTESGTLTDEDPPPVSWGASVFWLPFTPVVVAPPAAVGPYVGDMAIYDTLGATGSISGATVLAGDAYAGLTATGAIVGATLPGGDTIYDNLGATGTATGATLLPPENV